ncbi:MAG: aminoglycoside phosphotransferase family protein [Alphaproteobacteria bacterium]
MNQLSQIAEVARGLCGGSVGALEEIQGAGNHRVYRVDGGNGSRFALKTYFAGGADGNQRLSAEFAGLTYMWGEGMRSIPQPMAADRNAQCALFGWIDGDPVSVPTPADIDAAGDFVQALRNLARLEGAAELPLAREACLSPDEVHRQIVARRARLSREAAFRTDLAVFLQDSFDNTLHATWARAQRGFAAAGISRSANLPERLRTLSPSDFGFHNAVRSADGALVFCDFEYFGWDDPVKLVADFVVHPGMALDANLAARFEEKTMAIFADDPTFGARLNLLKPLYALRWALIVLNEFIPERWAQRAFAHGERNRNEVLVRQLGKAKDFVSRVQKEIAA